MMVEILENHALALCVLVVNTTQEPLDKQVAAYRHWIYVGRAKLAGVGAGYIRSMLRQTSFARKILPPQP